MADNGAADPAVKPDAPCCLPGSYDLGHTVTSACAYDQRFSYNLYVPARYGAANAAGFRLLVAVHGTDRSRARLREGFREFADRHDYIVLAPLFPA
ncbi:MAG TPA: hypothetical protein VE175_08625, partial [Woeseiaceae bacterium]|nr:hypothetical protein [Woeseiaceae bacterium]